MPKASTKQAWQVLRNSRRARTFRRAGHNGRITRTVNVTLTQNALATS